MAAAISPAGDLALCAHTLGLIEWSAVPREGENQYAYKSSVGTPRPVTCASFSPGGESLVLGFESTGSHCDLEIWGVRSMTCKRRRKVSTRQLYCFSFSDKCLPVADGMSTELLLVGKDKSIGMYRFMDLSFVGEYKLTANPTSICHSRSPKNHLTVLAGCQGGFLSVFDASPGAQKSSTCFQSKRNNRRELGYIRIAAVALRKQSVLCGHASGHVSVWCSNNFILSRVLSEKHTDEVSCIDICDDESFAVSGSNDGSLRVWDLDSWACPFMFRGHNAPIWTVNISPKNKRIVSFCKKGESASVGTEE